MNTNCMSFCARLGTGRLSFPYTSRSRRSICYFYFYIYLYIYIYIFFFVDGVLAVPPPIFARCLIFRNQSSHVENRTEPASQHPGRGVKQPIPRVGKGVPRFGIERAPSREGVSALAGPPGHTGGLIYLLYSSPFSIFIFMYTKLLHNYYYFFFLQIRYIVHLTFDWPLFSSQGQAFLSALGNFWAELVLWASASLFGFCAVFCLCWVSFITFTFIIYVYAIHAHNKNHKSLICVAATWFQIHTDFCLLQNVLDELTGPPGIY